MRMFLQELSPGVQDRQKADAGSEVFGIGPERQQRIRDRAEQSVVQRLLVELEERVEQLVGDGEDEVEVGHGQKLILALLEPLLAIEPLTLRAVAVATRVVTLGHDTASVADVEMPAERCGSAQLDGPHHPLLADGKPVGVMPVGIAIAAQDVGHLQVGGAHLR